MDAVTEPFIVQEIFSGNILEIDHEMLLDADPTINPMTINTTIPFPNIPWAQHNIKYTLYLPNKMTELKQGYLQPTNNEWSFKVGCKSLPKTIQLQNLHENIESMLDNNTLFQG